MPDKILSLKARAKNASNHAFPRSGLIALLSPAIGQLGAPVAAYDSRNNLYPNLAAREFDAGHNETGRLVYDSTALRALLEPLAIATLENEYEATNLDQAILRRQSQFLAKYKHVVDIGNAVAIAYPDKVNKLNDLKSLYDQHFTALETAYLANLPQGTTALQDVRSVQTSMSTSVAGLGSLQDHIVKIYNGDFDPAHPPPPANGPAQSQVTTMSVSRMATYNNNTWTEVTSGAPTTVSQQTVVSANSEGLRHPILENRIRHEKVTSEIIDKILAETIFALRVPYLQQIWTNEFADLDLDIRQLQLAFIETFLLPRANGVVTVINKAQGEIVQAGERVVQIASDDVLLLVGQVRRTGPISIGQLVTVTSQSTFEETPPAQLRISGQIVALSGYDHESDKWNIVIQCQNTTPKIPLGYDFETDSRFTSITFS